MVVFIGTAVDYGMATTVRGELQRAVDAAVVAGAGQYTAHSHSGLTAKQRAEKVLSGTFTKQTPTATVAVNDAERSIGITATVAVPTHFLQIIGFHSIPVSVEATARLGGAAGPPVCLHALHPSMEKAIEASGGTTLNAAPCVVWVNSASSKAVNLSGGSKLTALRNCVVGGFSQGLSNTVPAPENCDPRADPFADLAPYTKPTCDFTGFKRGGGAHTLAPGVYCGGITLSGGPTVTLQPGEYVIRDGPLTMSGGGSMSGTDVVFVVEGTGTVNLSGGGSYNLIGRKSGDFAGFLFFQRPTASPGATAKMTGGGALYYEGVIYFPTQKVEVSGGGTTGTPSPFTAYIAQSFLYSGGGELNIEYDKTKITIPVSSKLLTGDGFVYVSK
jgi:hypothetical protein